MSDDRMAWGRYLGLEALYVDGLLFGTVQPVPLGGVRVVEYDQGGPEQLYSYVAPSLDVAKLHLIEAMHEERACEASAQDEEESEEAAFWEQTLAVLVLHLTGRWLVRALTFLLFAMGAYYLARAASDSFDLWLVVMHWLAQVHAVSSPEQVQRWLS